MGILFLLKGLFLGLSVSAPVGPIGILCINRTINRNHLSGFVSGMGAATADLIYGIIAGLGLTFISDFLIEQKLWIQGIGLIILFFIGIRIIRNKRERIKNLDDDSHNLFHDYLSTFFLTVTNPLTILLFLGAFAAIGLSSTQGNHSSLYFLLAGLFIGSASWWLFLSRITHILKAKITDKILSKIDLISGSAICLIGFGLLINLLIEIL